MQVAINRNVVWFQAIFLVNDENEISIERLAGKMIHTLAHFRKPRRSGFDGSEPLHRYYNMIG